MLQPGSQVGRYEIQRRLGRGGMGTVYVAHDPVLGRMVAVKVFATDLDLPDAAQRFAREARAAAALNHPHIVTVHDYGDVSSQPFIVMEYVQGETLAEIIRRRAAVPLTEKLRWMEELCAGAAYAHRSGVLHRDIKPTNLMCSRSGQLKILDFGIARMLGTLSPKATALVGTPGYMAPEQILGEALDHRADLFSIGVVCYELLAYSDAFPGETLPTITHRILTQEPIALPLVVPDLPADLAAIVERSLRKNPAERFEDADAMRAAIARVRRQLDDDPAMDAMPRTVISERPPGGLSKRGTGSERRPVGDALGVAQLTPPPEPHRVDRELLARRRTEQIEACLERSRAALVDGDAPRALAECVQALTLEETHPGALELERNIQAVLAAQRAEALIEEAREELGRQALTSAQGLLEQAREINPESADLKRLEREIRLARVEETRRRQRADALSAAIESARQALARGETESAVAFAREAIALDPESLEAHETEAEAMRRLDEETSAATTLRPRDSGPGAGVPLDIEPLPSTVLSPGRTPVQRLGDVAVADAAPTVIVPQGRRTPAPAPPPIGPAAPARRTPATPAVPRRDVLGEVRAFFARGVTSMRTAVQARPKKERVIVAGSAAAVTVIVAIGLAILLVPRTVPTGIVMVDAVPWATITRIVDQDGTDQPMPALASTPVSLTLPAGTYTITLAGPPPDSESRIVTVDVTADGAATLSPERFRTMTPDEYFERYLTTAQPLDALAPLDGVPPAGELPVVPPPAGAGEPAAVSPQGATP